MTAHIYGIAANRIDGEPAKLDAFKGKVLLIVNVASKCGLTPQYKGLEGLHERYADRGFSVLGFPANEFGAQEPGTNAEIVEFCTTNYGVNFPMFEKIVVKGEGVHPLYEHLTTAQPKAQGDVAGFKARLEGYGIKVGRDDEVLWNFEKFLVNRRGEVIARFAPTAAPDDPDLTAFFVPVDLRELTLTEGADDGETWFKRGTNCFQVKADRGAACAGQDCGIGVQGRWGVAAELLSLA